MKLVFTRKEYKYHVPYYLLNDCINYFSRKMIQDSFNESYEPYIVRSLYYDSPSMRFYTEKISGNNNRRKIRLRTYGDKKDGAPVFLEFKNKLGEKIFKERVLLSKEVAKDVSLSSLKLDSKVAEEFHFYKKLYGIKPSAFIAYKRIGYLDERINFKVTVDYEIGASSKYDIWQDRSQMYSVNDQIFVLEMKFHSKVPLYFTEYIVKNNLQRMPFSKYTESIDALSRKEQGVFVYS